MKKPNSVSEVLRIGRLAVLGIATLGSLDPVVSDGFAQDVSQDRPLQIAPAPAKPKHVVKPHAVRPPPQHAVEQETAQSAIGQPAPALAATLPNGAASITERYGDWTVDCHINDGQKACVISQAQGNRQTGQRSFAIELRTPRDGKTEGFVLMPFGVKLENGAVLKLDDKALGGGLRFSTCVVEGCLLPVSFPAIATDAMKTAKTLSVVALNLSNSEAVAFNVSLDGFGAAFTRVADLGK
jgi:invasion protein IalB